jgi:protein-tyrosine-phosphatase
VEKRIKKLVVSVDVMKALCTRSGNVFRNTVAEAILNKRKIEVESADTIQNTPLPISADAREYLAKKTSALEQLQGSSNVLKNGRNY